MRRLRFICPLRLIGLIPKASSHRTGAMKNSSHQSNYLLDQQLQRLDRDFLDYGGLRERMTRARLAARNS